MSFTIVSNNCWGAHVYRQLGLQYSTPFIGTFLHPACYLDLVGDFRQWIIKPIRFVSESKHGTVNSFRVASNWFYPIGVLGDQIEIQFLHYRSASEAMATWNRRCERISSVDQQLFFKFCDRDACSFSQMATFDQTHWQNKVLFTSRPDTSLACAVYIPNCVDQHVPDGLRLSEISSNYFNEISWVTGRIDSDAGLKYKTSVCDGHPLRRRKDTDTSLS